MWASSIAAAVIVALLVGGAVYAYENKQNNDTRNTLQTQIDNLKTQVAAISPTATATPVATATPSPSVSPTPSATASPTATASATPTTVAQCASANLAVSLTSGSGTAGTYYYWLTLTNNGSQSCTMTGFPGVSLLDKSGVMLGQASRTSATAQKLTVAAGKAAYSQLGFPDAGNYSSGTCSTGADSLRVYPPNETAPLSIANIAQYNSPFTGQYCPGFSVGPVVASKQ